jgi:hypothetical protein
MFSLDAVTLIHELSGGNARTISVICDNVLVTGMALDRHRIDRATVMEVARDLHLAGKKPGTQPTLQPPRHESGPKSAPPTSAAVVTTKAEREQPFDTAAESSRREPRRSTVTAISPRFGRTIT